MNHQSELATDLLIIGGGPAGYTAATYAARAQLKPIVLEGKQPGGQLMGTTHVENWPGSISILGPDLMLEMRKQAEHNGAQLIQEEVVSVDLSQEGKLRALTKRGKTIHAKAIIVATGAQHKTLKCPGETEYWGKGVSVCAVCDAAFFKNKRVIVVGGGDTAMEEASFLTRYTTQVTVVHIGQKLTASKPMQQRVLENPNISVIYNSTVTQFQGNGTLLTGATITNQVTGLHEQVDVDGVFIAIGLRPSTEFLNGQVELLASGHIKLYEGQRTSHPGIFAAGDVADSRYRQAITSAGTGCAAALEAEWYLETLKS